MIAIVGDPGTPKVNKGNIAPPTAALFADSGPAIPSGLPLPNSSGFLETFFATLYPNQDAVPEPVPGNTPTIEPMIPPRPVTFKIGLYSLDVNFVLASIGLFFFLF